MISWPSDSPDFKALNPHLFPTASGGLSGAWEGAERDLHDKIEEELKNRRWYYVHSRMDKKTTTQLGVPDFIIAKPGGRTLWMEVKRKGEKLSSDQTITRHVLIASLHEHRTVYSFDEAVTFMDEIKEELK